MTADARIALLTDKTRYSPGSVVEIDVANTRASAILVGQCPLIFERLEQGKWREMPASEGGRVDECDLMLWTVQQGGRAPVITQVRAQFAPGVYRIAHRGIRAEGTEPFAVLYTNSFDVALDLD